MESPVRLTSTTAKLTPSTRVLKARDYQLRQQAGQLLADARREADALLGGAREAFQQQERAGYEQGKETARMEAAEQMMESVGQAVDYFANIEKDVTDVVLSSVRKIIAGFDDTELTTRVARSALEVVRDQHRVTLRVSPDDETVMRDRVGELLTGYPGIGYLEVVADHRLKAGGCILETELGVVDASIDLQLQALEKALKSKLTVSEPG